MVTPKAAVSTVAFIDDYCQPYQKLFSDVRNFEAFKFLHLGMICELPRKSLPAIAQAVGLKDGQSLHHFLRDATWDVNRVRETRLWLTLLAIGDEEIVLCIDETGDNKKGQATDYVARQYIGNIGKTKNGIVSVNAYGVVNGTTYPLLFKIFRPRSRLREGDKYKTKPELAVELVQELKALGFKIKLVLADSLYGESGDVIGVLQKLELQLIVAIRSNHGVLMPRSAKVRYNRWRTYEQRLSHRQSEQRFIREIIFGKRRTLRYFQITKGDSPDPQGDDSWYIMTNLKGRIELVIAQLYSLRMWIEYGFKQVKNELGWADFRLTDYASIERWWEIVYSAYLLVSMQATDFQKATVHTKQPATDFQKATVHTKQSSSQQQHIHNSQMAEFSWHPWWESGTTWKSALNNLRLIIQPYIFYCLIQPWLQVFPIPGFRRCFLRLISIMNGFRASPLTTAAA